MFPEIKYESDDDYHNKYLKYKHKYTDLQKKNNYTINVTNSSIHL